MPATSGGISRSSFLIAKFGGPSQVRAKEMYWPSSPVSVRWRCFAKNAFSAASDGTSRLAISARISWRNWTLFGEARSASYPDAFIAAITVNNVGLASSCPNSAGAACSRTTRARTTGKRKRNKRIRLRYTSSLPDGGMYSNQKGYMRYRIDMTGLLEQALKRVESLSREEQDAIAAQIIETLDDEEAWARSFREK